MHDQLVIHSFIYLNIFVCVILKFFNGLPVSHSWYKFDSTFCCFVSVQFGPVGLDIRRISQSESFLLPSHTCRQPDLISKTGENEFERH